VKWNDPNECYRNDFDSCIRQSYVLIDCKAKKYDKMQLMTCLYLAEPILPFTDTNI
jgi:hypothetical protein